MYVHTSSALRWVPLYSWDTSVINPSKVSRFLFVMAKSAAVANIMNARSPSERMYVHKIACELMTYVQRFREARPALLLRAMSLPIRRRPILRCRLAMNSVYLLFSKIREERLIFTNLAIRHATVVSLLTSLITVYRGFFV